MVIFRKAEDAFPYRCTRVHAPSLKWSHLLLFLCACYFGSFFSSHFIWITFLLLPFETWFPIIPFLSKTVPIHSDETYTRPIAHFLATSCYMYDADGKGIQTCIVFNHVHFKYLKTIYAYVVQDHKRR